MYQKNRSKDFMELLHEAFETSFRQGHTYIEVFVNPSWREYRSIGNYIRFIIDQREKKVYVWNARETIHITVAQRLNIPWHEEHIFFGQGILRAGSLHITEFYFADIGEILPRKMREYNGQFDYYSYLFHQDFSWLRHYYFNLSSYPGLNHSDD